MNTSIRRIILAAVLLAGAAEAAFTPPTQEQLQAAAKEPALVVALIVDANAEQAAEVGKDVVIEIVTLGLKPKERDARISQLVEFLFKAMPEDNSMELAVALGKAVAGSPTASMTAEIVSAIQLGIILAVNVEHGPHFHAEAELVGGAVAEDLGGAVGDAAGGPEGGESIVQVVRYDVHPPSRSGLEGTQPAEPWGPNSL
jgi:hypothetical protein